MRSFLLVIVVACLLLVSGCVSHPHRVSRHPHGMPPGQAKKLAHVHGFNCAHIFVGGIWIELEAGHVHGPDCGHLKMNGAWHAAARPGKGRRRHSNND